MTTHLRARAVRAGAFLAMVSGVLVVASTPAQAQPPNVTITSLSSSDLPSGGTTTLKYTITNTNPPVPGAQNQAAVQVTGMNCSGDCSPVAQIQPGDNKEFTAQLTAPQVGAGQTRQIQIRIFARIGDEIGNQQQSVTVRGADKPRTVRQVVGQVRDQDGKTVAGATVGLQDSQGHQYNTTSNDEGRFSFRSSDQQPILAGNLSIGAIKDGFQAATVSRTGDADKTLSVSLTLKAKETAATASPSASVTPSSPADEATDPATAAVSAPAAVNPQNAAQNDGSSSSMLFIIIGALLVAAGIGAIVLLLMRRRNARDDDLDDPDRTGGGGGVVPPSRGAFADPTRVAAPVGGRVNDPTMVARSGPSISDAPTMMQQAVPVEDEFPDPYGAPVTQGGYAGAGGYGTAAGTYGGPGQYGAGGAYGAAVPAQSSGYDPGPPTQYGRPPIEDDDPYAAYGAPQTAGRAGYGGEPRYDEPTGMYRPESDRGYGAGPEQEYGSAGYAGGDYGREPEYPRRGGGYPDAGYGPEPEQGGYGSWGAAGGGDGYPPPAGGTYGTGYGAGGPEQGYGSGGGAYRAPGQGGYDDGYEAPAYGRPEGYDRGQAAGGYGDDQYAGGQGGYYGGDQGTGRHGGQSAPRQQESAHPGQRRPLDWMDD